MLSNIYHFKKTKTGVFSAQNISKTVVL